MKGGFVHNSILLQVIIDLVRRLGGTSQEEFSVHSDIVSGSIDSLICLRGQRIACEAEMSCNRLQRDVLKALAADADLLLIVAPDAVSARAMTFRLRGQDTGKLRIKCAVLSDAVKELEAL